LGRSNLLFSDKAVDESAVRFFRTIDRDLFVQLLDQTTETVSRYRWQTSFWAQVVLRLLP
jgi:hypothetical protein